MNGWGVVAYALIYAKCGFRASVGYGLYYHGPLNSKYYRTDLLPQKRNDQIDR